MTTHHQELTPDQKRQIEAYKSVCINLLRNQHIRDRLSQDFQTQQAPRVANSIYALIRTGAYARDKAISAAIAPALSGRVLAEMLEVMADAGMTVSEQFAADCVDALFDLLEPWLNELDSEPCAACADEVGA